MKLSNHLLALLVGLTFCGLGAGEVARGGTLEAPLSFPFQLLSRAKARSQREVPFRLSLSPAAGTFSGSFSLSPSRRATPFQG